MLCQHRLLPSRFWVDDKGEGAATRQDIQQLIKDIHQKSLNIMHLLHRTQQLEASFSTEALIDLVEGGKHPSRGGEDGDEEHGDEKQQEGQQPPSTDTGEPSSPMPARKLQGLYNLEACGFPLHIPKQFLAKHWAFWKQKFRGHLTFPRYMCFNRFLTKEHLRELILRDPARCVVLSYRVWSTRAYDVLQ